LIYAVFMLFLPSTTPHTCQVAHLFSNEVNRSRIINRHSPDSDAPLTQSTLRLSTHKNDYAIIIQPQFPLQWGRHIIGFSPSGLRHSPQLRWPVITGRLL